MKETKYRKYTIPYYKKNPWAKYKALIASRCGRNEWYNGKRGRLIKNKISVGELKQLWFRDKAYLLETPSVDRIDSSGDYVIENCRFIELKENQRGKRHIFARRGTHCRRGHEYKPETTRYN